MASTCADTFRDAVWPQTQATEKDPSANTMPKFQTNTYFARKYGKLYSIEEESDLDRKNEKLET